MFDTRSPLPPPSAPPPTTPPPPPPAAPLPAPPGVRDRLIVAQLSGPGWLAATGAALLLVASVVVVAGQWSTIGSTARFSGLVGALFAVFFAAEACRSRVPTTGTALAVLAACVTAPVGIAAVAALDGEWPLCIAIGGGAALVASELQSRRWKVRTLKAATVVATGLLVAGLSVLVDIPAAVLGSVASTVALALGTRRRSVVLAILVPFVPMLWLLAEAEIGPGVLARMGVVGVADWVVPVSTLIAGTTIAVVAHQSRRGDFASAALVVLAFSALSALVEAQAPVSVWLSAPGLTAFIIGAVALGGERSIFSRWASKVRPVVATTLAVPSWVAPIVVVLFRLVTDASNSPLEGQLLLPAAVTLAAMLLLTATVERSSTMSDVVRLGCAANAVALVGAAGAPVIWVAIAALATWVLTTAITSWRSWLATSAAHSVWAVVALLASQTDPWPASVIIVLAAAIVVASSFASGESDVVKLTIPLAVGFGTTLLVVQWPGHLAALAAMIATAAATMTGIAMRHVGFTRADILSLSMGVGASTAGLLSGAVGASLGITLLAAQLWLYGVAFRRIQLAAGAAVVSISGLLSLWWTSGTNTLVIDAIAPYGASGQDLALGAAALALLGGGLALRTVQRPSTWLAYSPGLTLAYAWLLVAQGDLDADWATLGGLVVGVLAVGLGGARRLAAPLVIGTIGLMATGVISIGDRLAAAPTWTWIAAGGTGLIAVAAMLERSERPILPARTEPGPESGESFTQLFARSFE